MKPNLYQKIVLAVFSLLMLLLCIFFVPFTIHQGEYIIEYNPIWMANGIISTQRLIIEIFIILILFVVFYIYAGNKQVANVQLVKKWIKRELKIFLLLIASYFIIKLASYVIYKNDYVIFFTYKEDFNYYLGILYALIYPLRLIVFLIRNLNKYLNSTEQ